MTPEKYNLLCAKEAVVKHCRLTCHVCCADDTGFSFKTKNNYKKCQWLQKQKTTKRDRLCERLDISHKCAASCGLCD